jgi:hypothetical protein
MSKFYWLWLDIMSIPAAFLENKPRAKYHMKHICPKCPSEKKMLRDVAGNGKCWWKENWMSGNYTIPRDLGITNLLTQYLGWTDLEAFKKYVQEEDHIQALEEMPDPGIYR